MLCMLPENGTIPTHPYPFLLSESMQNTGQAGKPNSAWRKRHTIGITKKELCPTAGELP